MKLKLSRSPIWIAVDIALLEKMQVMLTFPSPITLFFRMQNSTTVQSAPNGTAINYRIQIKVMCSVLILFYDKYKYKRFTQNLTDSLCLSLKVEADLGYSCSLLLVSLPPNQSFFLSFLKKANTAQHRGESEGQTLLTQPKNQSQRRKPRRRGEPLLCFSL